MYNVDDSVHFGSWLKVKIKFEWREKGITGPVRRKSINQPTRSTKAKQKQNFSAWVDCSVVKIREVLPSQRTHDQFPAPTPGSSGWGRVGEGCPSPLVSESTYTQTHTTPSHNLQIKRSFLKAKKLQFWILIIMITTFFVGNRRQWQGWV